MGYNISQWKTKRLENLVIPFSALYDESLRKDWLPEKPVITEPAGDGEFILTIECGCYQKIVGFAVKEGELITAIQVTSFEMHGEGSGTFWHEVLKQALEKSTGTLKAVRIWEDGDYIDRLSVKDGVITETEVKL
jgi:hypothetical protein